LHKPWVRPSDYVVSYAVKFGWAIAL